MRGAPFLPLLAALASALTWGCGAATVAEQADPTHRPRSQRASSVLEPAAPVGVIVFASDRDGDWDIYAVDADGAGLRRLTDSDVDETDPAPSPDGRRLAFARSEADERWSVVIRERDGSEVELDGMGASPGDFAWSPDGKLLAVVNSVEEVVEIFDAGRTPQRSIACGGCMGVSWSPDGRLATRGFDESMNDVFELISIESGARIRLAGPPETWSPDGREFAFIRWNRGTASDRIDVAVARVATGETRTVASLDVDGEAYSSWYNLGVTATWSPDGDRIAFAAAVDGPRSEIFVVELQAASVSQLTSSEAGESAVHPEWSPDGRHLAFLRSRFRLPVSLPGLWDIWAMLADGTAARPLSEPFPDGGSNVGAAWTGQWHGNGAAGTPVTAIRTPLRAEAGMRGVGVDDLAADRDIAVADVSTPGASCARVGAWSPRLGRWLVLTAKAVVDWCLFERADALGIAGLRAAWVYSLSDPHGEGGVCVLGQRLEPGVSSARVLGRRRAWHCPEPALRTAAFPRAVTFDDVRGDGSLLVYTAWRCGHPSTVLDCADRREPRLWRVTGSRSVPLGHGAAADVDAGRIVAMTTSGAVRILNRDGRVLRTLPLGGATSAQLSGHDLAVVRDEALEVWNVRTGRRRAAYPLERGFGPVPVVEDAERGIASVVVGVAIHLIRLSDGKDLVLDIENQAGPSHAELEPAGLFYSWNEPYTRMPGRLAFAPWGQIVTAFG